MSSTLNHIHIFRTNIETAADKLSVKKLLDTHGGIERWSVDLDDIDRVLRVESHTLCCQDIIRLLIAEGYECSELE